MSRPFEFLVQNAVASHRGEGFSLAAVLTAGVPAHQFALIRVASGAQSSTSGPSSGHVLRDSRGTHYRKVAEVTRAGDGTASGVTLSLWYIRPQTTIPAGTVLELRCARSVVGRALTMRSYHIISPCPPFPSALRLHTVVLSGVGSQQGTTDAPARVQLAAPEQRPLFWVGTGAFEGVAPDTVPPPADWAADQEPLTTGAGAGGLTLFGQRRDERAEMQEWAPALGAARHWALILVAFYAGIIPPPTPTDGPCDLRLTVYADDGVTELWSVGTSPTHPRPYLVDPGQYEGQELDVATGSATLGTVTVGVVDFPEIAGDQDSGIMTRFLSTLGVPDLHGHRCRLERFISDAYGYQVVIDGPAGHVSLDSSFARYNWEIRDTRETERKIKIFEWSGDAAAGLRSLVPDELISGYGYDLATDSYRVRPGLPLEGHVTLLAQLPQPRKMTLLVGATEFPNQLARLRIWQEAYDSILNGIGRTLGERLQNNLFLFRWRLPPATVWTEIPGSALAVTLSTAPSTTTEGARVVGQVHIEDRRLDPFDPLYDPLAPSLPAEDDIVEFFLIGPVPTSERHPVIAETITDLVAGSGVFNSPNAPIFGRFILANEGGGVSAGSINLTNTPGNAEAVRRMLNTTFDRLGNASTIEDIFMPTGGVFAWRAAGSSDPWTEISPAPGVPGGSTVSILMHTPIGAVSRVWLNVILAAPTTAVPADLQDIEFTMTIDIPASQVLTAGRFAANVYAGLYSARDPITGAVVPTGVRYDEAALLLMTDPIRLRLTEPIEDARAWLESAIYAPTGWVPALDSDGRISPVSQVSPFDTTLLPTVSNANTEPSPRWDSGQRIVNILRVTYQRDVTYPDDDVGAYPDTPQADPPDPTKERQKVILSRPLLLEYRDEPSITRHTEQPLELDGIAFTALGIIPDDTAELTVSPTSGSKPRRRPRTPAPVTAAPLVRTGGHAQPISGNVADEVAYQLFWLRVAHVLNRYRLGAPTLDVNVMRSTTPDLRAGSWVQLELSWLPDYVTQRRGLLASGQIVALGELDCAWRRLLIEVVVPLPPES